MTLTDASPLVALINRNDEGHARCMERLSSIAGPMLTTWPCFTEAMYLLARYGGHPAQKALWSYVKSGALVFHDLDAAAQERMDALMERYRDRPMDLADASLVAASEQTGLRRVFTLDSDFYLYRPNDRESFEVVP